MAEEDILFGKNRHLFGGIEPSNMTKFDVFVSDGVVTIDARLPKDTVVNGQTLCTVAGAVIRRKTDGYPKDEFDGDKVADIKASMLLTDVTATATGCYYYAVFPYTAQGVYNRNHLNRASLNASEPAVLFSAKNVYNYTTETSVIELTVKLPDGAEGATIVRSTLGYPDNAVLGGDKSITVSSDGVYTDENVSIGVVYYYSVFPYKESGPGYSYEPKTACVKCARYNYLFGFDLDMNDPDPETRVTYPSDVDNYGYKPVRMNYDISTFDYGDWLIEPGEKFMPKPCMLNYNGTVAHYLDPNDYSKRDDGHTDSKVSDLTFEGQAMMEWPKIYTYREETADGIYKFRCSDSKLGEGWDCWCNYDDHDNQIEHFYTSIYACGLTKGTTDIQTHVANHMTLRSMSGINIETAAYYTRYRTAANRRNASKSPVYGMWGIGLVADHLLIQDLLVMMGKSTDCQTVFGNGVGGGDPYQIKVNGVLDTKGLFWGSNDQQSGVKVFGMENYWGNNKRYLDGWMTRNGSQYMKITRGTHDGTTLVTTYNTREENVYYSFGANYSYCLKVLDTPPSGTSGGYISGMIVKPYGRVPAIMSGSSTTYEADVFTWATDEKLTMYVGGIYSSTVKNGPFRADTSGVSSGQVGTCVGLSCKPVAISE